MTRPLEYVHPDLSSLLSPNDCTEPRIYTAMGFVKKLDGPGKYTVAAAYDPRVEGMPELTVIRLDDDGWRFTMGFWSEENVKALEELVGEDLAGLAPRGAS